MKHLDVNGARIAYTEAGTTGTPIFFVHGGFCAADDWRFQINDLASDHRVFALDLRGHGDSRVDDPRTACRLGHHPANIWPTWFTIDTQC